MLFDDIGEPPVYWCDVCGPIAHKTQELITKALDERPGFAEKLRLEIERAESGGDQ
jgi:hypothetical protein